MFCEESISATSLCDHVTYSRRKKTQTLRYKNILNNVQWVYSCIPSPARNEAIMHGGAEGHGNTQMD
jgi:hypothetical protein